MWVRRLRDADLEQAWGLDRESFNVPEMHRELFLAYAIADEFVGAFDGERLVAQSRAIAFAQFFGGRPVPMGGLSSVATAADQRGRGLGKRVVTECIELMHQRGDAISSLFPATTDLYRQLGWEVAGTFLFRTLVPGRLAALPEPEEVRVRRGGVDDLPALRGCYAALAARVNGCLDRGDHRWEAHARRWKSAYVFVAEDAAGAPVGYLVYTHVPGSYGALGGPFQLNVEELVATTRDAALALWRLLGSWSPQVERIIYRAPAEDPLLLLLPQQDMKVLEEIRWMTRMIDVVRAVETRGYPPGLETEAHLELRDAILPGNDGRFVLSVSKGRGRLEPGGRGAIQLDVASFAPLYTGWSDAGTLARAGRLAGGSDEERAALDAAFAGPTPWMLEQF